MRSTKTPCLFPHASSPGFTPLSFGLLQGSRMRSTKTEFVSCPSCGRTLFDLQEVRTVCSCLLLSVTVCTLFDLQEVRTVCSCLLLSVTVCYCLLLSARSSTCRRCAHAPYLLSKAACTSMFRMQLFDLQEVRTPVTAACISKVACISTVALPLYR